MSYQEDIMLRTVEEAISSAQSGNAPFAAAVSEGTRLISLQSNRSRTMFDPTAHAEICAIRAACVTLQKHDLTGLDLYSSSEPCPMCMAACYWANIQTIYFAISIEESTHFGYADNHIYEQLGMKSSQRDIQQIHCSSVPKLKLLRGLLDTDSVDFGPDGT